MRFFFHKIIWVIFVNIQFINNKKIIVKVNTHYKTICKSTIKEECEKILYFIHDRFNYNIYGSYDVRVFFIDNFITMFLLFKKNDDDYYKYLDINIIKVKNNVSLNFQDFLLVKKYNKCNINSGIILKNDVLKLCEHYLVDTSIYNDFIL